MYWEEKQECIQRDELEQLQLERLESTLNRVYMNVPFYRKRFDEHQIDSESIRSIDELQNIPFTTKNDLMSNYPYGLFAVPLREVVRVHASSGTKGMSTTVVGYTKNDIRTWSDLTARILTAGGITKDDVVQISFGYGLITGGFGMHYGAERIGASVIPTSSGNTKRQIKIMQDYKTTAFIGTASYALHLADKMFEMGININALSLKYGLLGGEPWSEAMRQDVQDRLKIIATDNYGLSEIIGPGIAGECSEQNGLHINEDHFLAEVIDPKTLIPAPAGELGELVITTLTKEAYPMIRYRTGDLTRLIEAPCSCGRTFVRMERVSGRSDDMMIVKGVNVFPSQIVAVLSEIDGLTPHYQIVVDRKNNLDELTVLVEVSEETFFDIIKKQRQLVDRIQRRLASELGISVKVKPVEKKTLKKVVSEEGSVVDRRRL
jgi:phenylacetate-CoA ligase